MYRADREPLPIGHAAAARIVVALLPPVLLFVVYVRAARAATVLQPVMALPRHLLSSAVDNVSRIGVAGLFHIGVLTVQIWVLICHEHSLLMA